MVRMSGRDRRDWCRRLRESQGDRMNRARNLRRGTERDDDDELTNGTICTCSAVLYYSLVVNCGF